MQSSTLTKQLILECADGLKGVVDILETDTLAHVRNKIYDEWDDDLIPLPDFGFHVDEIRISLKQEKKNKAWDVLSKKVRLQQKIISCTKNVNSNRVESVKKESLPNNAEIPASKRIKSETSQLECVSPALEVLCMEYGDPIEQESTKPCASEISFTSDTYSALRKESTKESHNSHLDEVNRTDSQLCYGEYI